MQASEGIAKQFSTSLALNKIWGDVIFNVKAYGAKGNGSADDTQAINDTINAATAASGGTVVFPSGTYAVGTITVPSNILLQFQAGAKLSIGSGQTATINGGIDAGLQHIFSGVGKVAGSMQVDRVYPQWWGAVSNNDQIDNTTALQKSIDCAIQTGVTLHIPPGTIYCQGEVAIWGTCRIEGERGKLFGVRPSVLSYLGNGTFIRVRKKLNADGPFVNPPVSPGDPGANVGSLFVERVNFTRRFSGDTTSSNHYGNQGYGINAYFMSEFKFNECGFIGFLYAAYIPTASIGEFVKCDFVSNSYGLWMAPDDASDPVRGTFTGASRISVRDCNSWVNYEASFVPGINEILFDGCHSEVSLKHFYIPVATRNRVINNVIITGCNCNSGNALAGFAPATLDASLLYVEVTAGTSFPLLECFTIDDTKVRLRGSNAKPIYFNGNGTSTTFLIELEGNMFNSDGAKVVTNQVGGVSTPQISHQGYNVIRDADNSASAIIWGDGAHSGFSPDQSRNTFFQGIAIGKRLNAGASTTAGQIEYDSTSDRFELKTALKTMNLPRFTESVSAPTDDGTHKVGDIVFNAVTSSSGMPLGWAIRSVSPFFISTIGQVGFRQNAGTPVGVLTPQMLGEYCFDSTNKVFYDAVGLTSADWKARS